MKYCSECGTKLIEKECGIDGLVPYCPTCKQFRFPMFNSAISTIIFNPTKDKILLIKQYGKDFNVLVAGYITKGENAKLNAWMTLAIISSKPSFVKFPPHNGRRSLRGFSCFDSFEDLETYELQDSE